MDGVRFIARSGPSVTRGIGLTRSEGEAFWYRLWSDHLNLAMHAFVGQTSNDSVDTQFFLGGFDSIRGIPDGALYGTRAVYGNAEFRKITAQWRYLWVQQVLFADGGGAGQSWNEVENSRRASAGLGVRLAIPQVYRMVFRIDYAWSLDRPGTRGISAGLNQFFQPYAPL
jgi:hemolysin activation/secretion protein